MARPYLSRCPLKQSTCLQRRTAPARGEDGRSEFTARPARWCRILYDRPKAAVAADGRAHAPSPAQHCQELRPGLAAADVPDHDGDDLTMNAYTDPTLLDVAGDSTSAWASLPDFPEFCQGTRQRLAGIPLPNLCSEFSDLHPNTNDCHRE